MKLAPLRKLHRLHCLLPASEVITDGIVEVHSVSHLFPMHGCKGSVWLNGSGKVGRQSRFGQNLPQTSLSVFNPKTLSLSATRLKSIRQRKQATGGKSEDRKEWLTDEAGYWCFICKPFLFLFVRSPLLLNHRADGKLHSFKINQVILYR